MNYRISALIMISLGLVISACAPASATPTELSPQVAVPGITPSVEEAAILATPTVPPESLEMPLVVPQAVATSRGADLEATDPASVNLASGELQLVEFFRFT